MLVATGAEVKVGGIAHMAKEWQRCHLSKILCKCALGLLSRIRGGTPGVGMALAGFDKGWGC